MKRFLFAILVVAACSGSLVDQAGVSSSAPPIGTPGQPGTSACAGTPQSCGTTSCGPCSNPTPACVDNVCVAACDAPTLACDDGACCAVSHVAAGGDTSCAILSDGSVRCWGLQLGSVNPVPAPIKVTGLSSPSAISVGGAHACAIVSGGVVCWGANDAGQLGHPSPANSTTPLAPVPGVAGATAIAAGGRHTCALTPAGVMCWGANESGQLGDGQGTLPHADVVTVAGTGNATSLASGLAHTCATVAGVIECWGSSSRGQAGDAVAAGTFTPVPEPVAFRGGGAGTPSLVVAGEAHTCSILSSSFQCWGAGESGQLGNNSIGDSPTTQKVLMSIPYAVAAGRAHTCAATIGSPAPAPGDDDTGGVPGLYCWGANTTGQLGTGGTSPSLVPGSQVQVQSVGELAAGTDHTCVLIPSTGALLCWGRNDKGQAGTGALTPSVLSPAQVTGAKE